MSRKTTKRIAAIIAITLAVLMVISVVLTVTLSSVAGAATTSKLDEMKNKQKDIKAQQVRIKEQIAGIKADKKDKITLKIALDEEIRLSEEEIENITELIQEYTVHIADTQRQYEAAESALEDTETRFLERLRVMEESGQTSYIAVLMQSSSFSDLLGRWSVISEIAEYDRQVIEELKNERARISEFKSEMEDGKAEQVTLKSEQVDAQAALILRYEELDQMIADLESDQLELAAAYKKAEEEEKKVEADIQRAVEEAARKNTVYVGGDFTWPLPGYFTISSPFGYRRHPVLGVNKLHTGTDLPAPTGTKIIAANSGTVVLATYNGSYGNCVVIDHGGGRMTLYAHSSKLLVQKGAKVSKGDVIALVGSTGMSTGPHLHFEVIIDGVKKNPMSYFQKVT
ncbi:peptidase M23 [Clostridia bacterium]|nr:peptidase M23 [Clostridia bacterium]